MAGTLSGKYFLNTRPRNQGRELSLLLGKEGARILEFPTVDITAPRLTEENRKKILEAPKGSWLIFTSSNGIRGLAAAISKQALNEISGIPGPHLFEQMQAYISGKRIAVVGRGTAETAAQFGMTLEFISPEASGEGLAESFVSQYGPSLSRKQTPVYFSRSNIPNEELSSIFFTAGVNLIEMELYNAQIFHPGIETLRRLRLALTTEDPEQALSGVILTSGGCGKNLIEILNQEGEHKLVQKLFSVPTFAIGEKTKGEAEKIGFNVLRVARSTNIKGLARSIVCHFAADDAQVVNG